MQRLLRISVCALLFLWTVPAVRSADQPDYRQRWFYAPFNLLVDRQTDELIHLIGQARKAGYNGMLLADYKLNILAWMGPEFNKRGYS
jgi:hypothetical protein